MIIETKDINEARRLIQKAGDKDKPVIVKAQDDAFNRKMLELGKFDILLNIEAKEKGKDSPKQLDSGLNNVLAKIAAKNKISIGINLEDIRKLSKEEKARRLARIKQNLQICRKARTRFVCLNHRDKRDAIALLISLGASTQQATDF